MIVKEITENDEFDYPTYWELHVDGERRMGMGNLEDCPEDASLGRGLNDVFCVVDLMKLAYEAGKNGESFEIG